MWCDILCNEVQHIYVWCDNPCNEVQHIDVWCDNLCDGTNYRLIVSNTSTKGLMRMAKLVRCEHWHVVYVPFPDPGFIEHPSSDQYPPVPFLNTIYNEELITTLIIWQYNYRNKMITLPSLQTTPLTVLFCSVMYTLFHWVSCIR